MATVSARIDDQVKAQAEKIAEDIGIPLSSAINIFLRKFISVRGFPFDVKANDNMMNAEVPMPTVTIFPSEESSE